MNPSEEKEKFGFVKCSIEEIRQIRERTELGEITEQVQDSFIYPKDI